MALFRARMALTQQTVFFIASIFDVTFSVCALAGQHEKTRDDSLRN